MDLIAYVLQVFFHTKVSSHMSRYLFIELAEVCVDLFRHDNHLCLQCVAVCCIVSPFCCSSFDKSFCQCRVTGGRFDAESIGLFYGSFFICVGLV